MQFTSPQMKELPWALRWPLFWWALALVVITGGFLALSLNFQRVQSIEAGHRLTDSFAQVIEEQTSRTIQTVDQRLQLAALALAGLRTAGTLNEHTARSVLREQNKTIPFVRAIWVLDAQGRILYDADEGNIGISLQDRPYFQIYLSQPDTRFYLGAPVRSRSTGTWLVSASRPLKNANGRFDGIIVAAVEPPYFDKLWQNINLGQGGSIALMSRAGVMMMRSPINDDAMGKSFHDSAVFKTLLPQSPNGSYEDTSSVDATVRLYSYRTLTEYPAFLVIVGQSRNFVLAAWRHLATVAGLVWFISAVTVLLLALLLDRVWRQRARVRALSEQALRDSEARYRALFESNPHPMWVYDVETLAFLAVNDAAIAHYGYSRAEFLAMTISDIRPKEDVPKMLEDVANANSKLGTVGLWRHLRKDGSVILVEVTAHSLAFGDRPARLIHAHDVTEAYRANEALAATTSLLERTGEMAKVGGWEFDLRTRKMKLSKEALRLNGSEWGSDLPLEPGLNVSSDDIRSILNNAMQSAVATGEPFDLVVPRSLQGRTMWLRIQGSAVFENGQAVKIQGAAQDITEQKLAEQSTRIAATAFETQQGMTITDAQGTILQVNKAFTKITGYSAQEVIGRNSRLLQSGRHDAAFYKAMWDSIMGNGFWEGEVWNTRKNGETYPEWIAISAVKDDASAVTHYVGAFTDISDRKSADQRIESLFFYDTLTGLPNRTLLRDRLQHALMVTTRSHRQAALLHIDLDNFKYINDTLGHDQGDRIIEEVARRLRTCARVSDTLARIGGDEFVLLVEGIMNDNQDLVNQSRVIGDKVLDALRQPYQLGESIHHSGASIGIALFGGAEQHSIDEPLKQAELAMYQAKAAGRNTLRFYDPQMQADVSARANMESRLIEALAKGQFALHYQPQVDHAGQVTGAEALVRWLDPKRGMVSPGEFIPVAEQSDLILQLGNWVLETACNELVRWADDPAMAELTVSVNVSARQFRQSTFVEGVVDTLKRIGVNPERLKLELTENMLVEDITEVIAKMSTLKSYGVSFSLDDFGTGYSSLSYLKLLPLDQLKIDQGFVRDILIDANDAAIARTVIALAQSMGLGVIAEGVETEGQRDFLAKVGCRAFQGYLFSKPLPMEEFEALVKRM